MTTEFDTSTNTYSTIMTIVHCYACGVPFGLSATHYDSLQASGESFCCPNGHKQHFTKRKDLEARLKDAKDRTKMLRNMYEGEQRRHKATERKLSARKGQITKMKNRAAAGVCPCCNRTFQQLADHMRTQHPDYAKEPNDD